jgi:hypothetical protein
MGRGGEGEDRMGREEGKGRKGRQWDVKEGGGRERTWKKREGETRGKGRG